MVIKFGTSGWRAIIADEFTFANVRRVTGSICNHLQASGLFESTKLVVSYDTRFLGERFAEECVDEITANGFNAIFCDQPTPTPTLSHTVRSLEASGAINFTASHNPPEYNGMKFSTADGAPAMPEVTRKIEERIQATEMSVFDKKGKKDSSKVEVHDPRPAYFADLENKVRFDTIANAGGSYAYDPLWGTGRGYLDQVLRNHGVEVETIHDWRDVLFGGRSPEPDDEHLEELREAMRRRGCVLGLATDGDGDRFGVVDRDGTFITPNQLIPVLFDYLVESRGWTQGVARSVATSHLVDRVAKSRDLPVYETPVGFKFIGEMINEDKIVLGGEESAGLSIRGHYPEKDGILACLLAAEAVAARGASLKEQLGGLYALVGRLESKRVGVRLTPDIVASLPERLARDPQDIGGRRVASVNRADGVKFIFADGSWLLLRPSGTEPVVRIYAESESANDLEVLIEQGRKFLLD
ncbi:MAG TPA: phosphoglucomutase/phosphomannomutase family protein [Pyrinomonadaceae bacterium]|jgi:phosphoglucomutase|nr:phosphoglucomutase/phosphomannomutase family protein [Pyrinomonadaceae bacterium]